jgi:proton glutamate symport protein
MGHDTALPWYRQLHWQVFIAMFLGIATGVLFGTAAASRLGWIGELFMRLLRMVIVPLVLTSIITGVASVGGGRAIGRMFSKTLGYYALSSLLAILTGLFLVNIIQPGASADMGQAARQDLPVLATPGSLTQLILDIVPNNVFQAAASADMLAIIFFAIVFGLSITALPTRTQGVLQDLFEALFQTMMWLTRGIIRLLPIGIFALMTTMVATTGFERFRALGLYMVTIAAGLSIHLFLVLPLLLILLGRISPRVHFANMREPLLVAFSTSSSGATLPVTMNIVEKQVGVSNRVTSFVLPMGATINMDGTALYECAGALFVAQVLGFDLSLVQQGVVVLTALLASIGSAAIPSAGLVVIFIVLEAINLRGPEVNLIVGSMLAIDRPLDMLRTAVNVFSDSCCAAVVARSEGETEVDVEMRSAVADG